MNPCLKISRNGTPKTFAIAVRPAITADNDQRAAIALACKTAERPSRDIVSLVVGAINVQVTSNPNTRSPRTTWAKIANCKVQLVACPESGIPSGSGAQAPPP